MMNFPTEDTIQAVASSSRRHDSSSESHQSIFEGYSQKPHFPTFVPSTQAKEWLLVTDQQQKKEAANIAAAAFREAHHDLRQHGRIVWDIIMNAVNANAVTLSIPSPRVIISFKTGPPACSPVNVHPVYYPREALATGEGRVTSHSHERETGRGWAPPIQFRSQTQDSADPTSAWNWRQTTREKKRRKEDRWKANIRARRSEGHRGRPHPRQSCSNAQPSLPARTGSMTPSGRAPPLPHWLVDEKDIDVLDQRRRDSVMASLYSIQLTMDDFLYAMGKMDDAVDDLEFEIVQAKADLAEVEADRVLAEKSRHAAIWHFQVTYRDNFQQQMSVKESLTDFAAGDVRMKLLSSSKFALSSNKSDALSILFDLDARILQYDIKSEKLATAKTRAKTSLRLVLSTFEESVAAQHGAKDTLRAKFEAVVSQRIFRKQDSTDMTHVSSHR